MNVTIRRFPLLQAAAAVVAIVDSTVAVLKVSSFFRKRICSRGYLKFIVTCAFACLVLIYGVLPCPSLYSMLRSAPRLQSDDNTNLTIVTAFFNIGDFQKGTTIRKIEDYLMWSNAFRYLQNPLVIFTDSQQVLNYFTENNNHHGQKQVQLVHVENRKRFFMFQTLEQVGLLFSDPSYPKFYPNTVSAVYSCTQNAKMDVMEEAISRDYFHTKYYAWMDFGYFREIAFEKQKFWVIVPTDMDNRKIMACEVEPLNLSLTPEMIFKKNLFGVGGGMYLGTAKTFSKFVREYRHAYSYFLYLRLASTDQQVVYSMMQPQVKKDLGVTTELQLRSWIFNMVHNCWFHLGYSLYRKQ